MGKILSGILFITFLSIFTHFIYVSNYCLWSKNCMKKDFLLFTGTKVSIIQIVVRLILPQFPLQLVIGVYSSDSTIQSIWAGFWNSMTFMFDPSFSTKQVCSQGEGAKGSKIWVYPLCLMVLKVDAIIFEHFWKLHWLKSMVCQTFNILNIYKCCS